MIKLKRKTEQEKDQIVCKKNRTLKLEILLRTFVLPSWKKEKNQTHWVRSKINKITMPLLSFILFTMISTMVNPHSTLINSSPPPLKNIHNPKVYDDVPDMTPFILLFSKSVIPCPFLTFFPVDLWSLPQQNKLYSFYFRAPMTLLSLCVEFLIKLRWIRLLAQRNKRKSIVDWCIKNLFFIGGFRTKTRYLKLKWTS